VTDIFSQVLENPNPLEDDEQRLIKDFELLKTSTAIPVISNSSAILMDCGRNFAE
jgi:hypothetical protein